MDTTYHPESEEAMCCPICTMYLPYQPSNTEQTDSCISFENYSQEEDGSEEVDQDRSDPELLSLFPVTPDLQPSNQESVTSAPAEHTRAEETFEQLSERGRRDFLLHFGYIPLRTRLSSMIYVNARVAYAMSKCQCNLCIEDLARLWVLTH